MAASPREDLGRALKKLTANIDARIKNRNGKTCQGCGANFFPRSSQVKYCDGCHQPSPAVYRFVAPNGMSYIGSSRHVKIRRGGLWRINNRIRAVVKKYPPETWAFEILEELLPECSEQELRAAEQRHIDRLGTLDPDRGFNINPAVREGCQSQNQTARDYGVTPHCLKQWEKFLGFPPSIVAGAGWRFYRIADLDNWDRQWDGLTREAIARKVGGKIELLKHTT
jgi:hypothetical protein